MKTLRILLVEDDESLRNCLTLWLESQDYRVTESPHGKDAWNKITATPQCWDAAIIDYQMPEMDGVSLIDRIALLPNHDLKLIILSTAVAADDDPMVNHLLARLRGRFPLHYVNKGDVYFERHLSQLLSGLNQRSYHQAV